MAWRWSLCAGAFALGACGDSTPSDPDAARVPDAKRIDAPPIDAAVPCAGVLDPEAEEVGLYTFMDTLAEVPRPPSVARVGFENSCWNEHERGQWLSTWWVTTATHDMFIDVDGQRRFSATVPYGDLDLKLWAIDDVDPAVVVSLADRSTAVPAGWKLHLANLSGAPIDIYQLPGGVPVATAVPHGAGIEPDLAITAASGARIRVVRAGVEVYRGSAGFWSCDAGRYLPGIHVFAAIIETGRNPAAAAWASNAEGVYCEGGDPGLSAVKIWRQE